MRHYYKEIQPLQVTILERLIQMLIGKVMWLEMRKQVIMEQQELDMKQDHQTWV